MGTNKESLTHHEQLRLDYLSKNIHYLNDKEKRELAYLLTKQDTEQSPSSVRYSSSFEHQSVKEEMDDAYFEEEVILPTYPSRKRRKAERRMSKAESFSPSYPSLPKKKKKKGKVKRFALLFLSLIGLLVSGLVFSFFKGYSSVSDKPVAEVFQGAKSANGTNILILGTDGRIGESSEQTRTDSIMVLNINNRDNKVKLVSFMRDILIDIEGYDYKLNAAYTLGEQNNMQGAEEVRRALKNNFDIDIQYYALVDFATFATVIDTLFPEGVTMDAQFSTVDGEAVSSVEVPDDLNMVDGLVPSQTISVGVQQMDGRTLLNYARFRKDDEGDFGRTRRQQEVLTAIIQQSKNPMKLFAGSEALGKAYALTPTTVPQTFMWLQGPGVVLDAANGVERMTVPENGDWVDDFDIYDGMGLRIDFAAYQERLAAFGLR